MTSQLSSAQPIWANGKWRASADPKAHFRAVDPSTRLESGDEFPVSGPSDLEMVLAAGELAARKLQASTPEQLAALLDATADELEARAQQLVDTAARETGLPASPRLEKVELPRTTGQLRQAAEAAREQSWREAVIDTKAGLRTQRESLPGPVVIFGPNNFPFAFNGICGGDFAAAIAAGNPVIAKGHPAHPATTRLLAEAAFEALKRTQLPPQTVQLLYHLPTELGFALVGDPRVGAISFTGSRQSGLQLKSIADRAGNPIYLELSSVNPTFVLPGALQERGSAIAKELAGSCALGAGQFCTNPGLSVVVDDPRAQPWIDELSGGLDDAPRGLLLNAAAPSTLERAVLQLVEGGAQLVRGGKALPGEGSRFDHTLLRVSGDQFLCNSEVLQREAFGVVHMVIVARDVAQMCEIAQRLEGNLTGCIYSDNGGGDDAAYQALEPILRTKVGRLLNDKMPTGVAVSPAMHHGGPYPCTGHPGFTSVGIPASLTRFSARRCYDNVRHQRLPTQLRDENPNGKMWRHIDGQWTRGPVTPADD